MTLTQTTERAETQNTNLGALSPQAQRALQAHPSCSAEYENTPASSVNKENGTNGVESTESAGNLTPLQEVRNWLMSAWGRHLDDERGMSTIEYAVGCIAAAALAGLLFTVVNSGAVEQALTGIFERALNQGPK